MDSKDLARILDGVSQEVLGGAIQISENVRLRYEEDEIETLIYEALEAIPFSTLVVNFIKQFFPRLFELLKIYLAFIVHKYIFLAPGDELEFSFDLTLFEQFPEIIVEPEVSEEKGLDYESLPLEARAYLEKILKSQKTEEKEKQIRESEEFTSLEEELEYYIEQYDEVKWELEQAESRISNLETAYEDLDEEFQEREDELIREIEYLSEQLAEAGAEEYDLADFLDREKIAFALWIVGFWDLVLSNGYISEETVKNLGTKSAHHGDALRDTLGYGGKINELLGYLRSILNSYFGRYRY